MNIRFFNVCLVGLLAVIFFIITVSFQKCNAKEAELLSARISEVYYNPSASDDSGQEFVKIFNPNDTEIDISGYDLYTGKYYTLINAKIEPHKYITIHINAIGSNTTDQFYTGTNNQANMSDSSGSVALFSSSTHSKTTIIDFVQYGSGGKTWQAAAIDAGIWNAEDFIAKTDIGYAMRLSDAENDRNLPSDWEFYQIAIILDNTEEQSEFEDDEDQIFTSTIEEARNIEAGKFVRVQGKVTVIPSKLSDQYFYIEDTTGGIQIYCYKKDFPTLSFGDLIEVVGEIGSYYSDVRIKIAEAKDIQIIQSSKPVVPADIKISEITDSVVGELIAIEGEVTKTSGDTFYLEENGSEVKISIKEQTAIDKPKMAVGDKVRIIGVVSKYKNSYQVLPFEQAGVTILTSGKLPSSGKLDANYYKSILILSLWKLSPKTKKRLKKLLKTMPKV